MAFFQRSWDTMMKTSGRIMATFQYDKNVYFHIRPFQAVF